MLSRRHGWHYGQGVDLIRLQPSAFSSVTCAVPIDALWAVASDPELFSDFSTELQEIRLLGSAPIGLGSVFEGDQLRGERRWTTTSTVTAFEAPQFFEWTVGDLEAPVSRWSFLLDEHSAGTTLVHSVVLLGGPSPLSDLIASEPARADEMIHGRLEVLRERMNVTVRGLIERAERVI